MLHFDIIDVSERTDVNKTSESKECDICYYWYFLNKGFKFQSNVCNGCYDLLVMSMNLSDIAILNIKGSDYRCIISRINKNDHKLVAKCQFEQKKWKIIKHKKFIIIYKSG